MSASARTAFHAGAWAEANRSYILCEVERVRLDLRRHVEALRARRGEDPLERYRRVVVSDADADAIARGRTHEPAPTSEAQALAAELTRAQMRRSEALARAGTPVALEALAAHFELMPFEQDVLRLCLAPELEPDLGRLIAYAQDDVAMTRPAPHLALGLYGGDGLDWLCARDSLAPGAPLRRFALVRAHDDGTLHLTPRMCDYLLGANELDADAAELLRPVEATPLTAAQRGMSERLAATTDGGRLALNVIGPPGSGRHAIARELCAHLGLELHALAPAQLPEHGGERREALRILERESALLGLAYYIDASSALEGPEAALAREAVERLHAPIVVGSRERWNSGRGLLPVRVPPTGAAERRALWNQALEGTAVSPNGHVDALAEQFELGPRGIAEVVSAACARSRARPDARGIGAAELWDACREQTATTLDELAERIDPVYGWDEIVLPADVTAQLHEIAAQLAHRAKVYGEWGFGTKLSRGRGISALFAGASGTGKTMAAEVLAQELKLDLYRIDLAGMVSKYIGETEKNLRHVFDAAERNGAILFFDEADALFGKRTEVRDSHDRYANIEVNYLLQRMESYRGLAILATNRKSALDQAFMRRLRFVIDFPLPDASIRRGIWERVFPPEAATDGLDLAFLSRLDITGGHIRNIAVAAAFLAASEGASIGMEHVVRAARREYEKISKLVQASEFGPYYSLVAG